MNAKQLMDFADKYAYEPNMFNDLERTLDEEKFNILVELESNPGDKKTQQAIQRRLRKDENGAYNATPTS